MGLTQSGLWNVAAARKPTGGYLNHQALTDLLVPGPGCTPDRLIPTVDTKSLQVLPHEIARPPREGAMWRTLPLDVADPSATEYFGGIDNLDHQVPFFARAPGPSGAALPDTGQVGADRIFLILRDEHHQTSFRLRSALMSDSIRDALPARSGAFTPGIVKPGAAPKKSGGSPADLGMGLTQARSNHRGFSPRGPRRLGGPRRFDRGDLSPCRSRDPTTLRAPCRARPARATLSLSLRVVLRGNPTRTSTSSIPAHG